MDIRCLQQLAIAVSLAATGLTSFKLSAAQAGAFVPPSSNSAPRQSSGGASRGDFNFIPPPDSQAPRRASSGASRDAFFSPPPENQAPRRASGGASRDAFFIPPPQRTSPERASGGSSRSAQIIVSSPTVQDTVGAMHAITPDSFYGHTLLERPAILAYVPQSDVRQAIFRLKDEAQNLIYEQVIAIPPQGGIVMVQLPETAPALVEGQHYQWFLALTLNGTLKPDSPFVDAWITRIEPSDQLRATLSGKNTVQVVEVLAQNGIWYDAVAELASLRQQQFESESLVQERWQELLVSVKLAKFVESPIHIIKAFKSENISAHYSAEQMP